MKDSRSEITTMARDGLVIVVRFRKIRTDRYILDIDLNSYLPLSLSTNSRDSLNRNDDRRTIKILDDRRDNLRWVDT